MKNILLFIILFSYSIQSQQDSEISFYGDKINFENISEFSEIKSNASNNSIKIEGEILSSCPKKGCWMEVKFDTDTVFVKFKDYGFFVPKNGIEGKKAVINGILSTETISVKELQHYAADAGKSELEISKINKPEIKFSFLADGVIIKN